mmetsp:Transcript_53239/g.126757  ORF Transcript_53239/g.126757 Transcript_53239/m.126757 type:complete len:237 (+) Transcript_53239:149-859(+)
MGREEARVMAIVKQFAEQEKASLKRQRLLESRKKQREQERPAWISKMMEKMQKAPTFYPTMEQFQTPQEYIGSISADGAKYGACKIVPPAEFTPQIHRPEHAIATKHQQVLVRTECLSHSSEEEGGQKKKSSGPRSKLRIKGIIAVIPSRSMRRLHSGGFRSTSTTRTRLRTKIQWRASSGTRHRRPTTSPCSMRTTWRAQRAVRTSDRSGRASCLATRGPRSGWTRNRCRGSPRR